MTNKRKRGRHPHDLSYLQAADRAYLRHRGLPEDTPVTDLGTLSEETLHRLVHAGYRFIEQPDGNLRIVAPEGASPGAFESLLGLP